MSDADKRVPCPTCGGAGLRLIWREDWKTWDKFPCPDCADGTVTPERAAEIRRRNERPV